MKNEKNPKNHERNDALSRVYIACKLTEESDYFNVKYYRKTLNKKNVTIIYII